MLQKRILNNILKKIGLLVGLLNMCIEIFFNKLDIKKLCSLVPRVQKCLASSFVVPSPAGGICQAFKIQTSIDAKSLDRQQSIFNKKKH
jgi:hypothetical protein